MPPALNSEQLRKFTRTVATGEFLFHQNDLGNTMFVIIEGEIELVEHRRNEEFVVGIMGVGQILGEKAFLTEVPYHRTFSARAKVNCSLLEFERKHIKIVETIIPNFALRILQIAAQRLDRANKIIKLLHYWNPIERLARGILFFNDESGKQTTAGYEITITPDDLVQLTNVNRDTINMVLEELTRAQIIRTSKNGMLLTDPDKLLQFVPDLSQKIAA
jgi:CRP-like cAMP-binding protein